MSSPQRRRPASVVKQLLTEPQRFGFFQAMRLFERWFAHEEGLPAGDSLRKKLRFRNSLSLSFPTGEIEALELRKAELDEEAAAEPNESDTPSAKSIEQLEITPTFMGLLGHSGTLPIFYTELFAQRELYHRDRAARAFMDVFADRAVSMFYEAWKKHRLHLQYENDRQNRFLPLVLALAGLGQGALRDRLNGNTGGLLDETVAYFAGAVQQRPVSAVQMQRILSDYLRVPIKVEQFVGRWFELPPEQRTRLGVANAQLGSSAFMGQRVWQRALRMRLVVGPMKRGQLNEFLPSGRAAEALRELVTLFTGVAFEYEVRLVLEQSELRPVSIDGGRADNQGRLGWDTWMVTRFSTGHRDDAGYEIHAVH